jgi:hypothetical protein
VTEPAMHHVLEEGPGEPADDGSDDQVRGHHELSPPQANGSAGGVTSASTAGATGSIQASCASRVKWRGRSMARILSAPSLK